MSLGSIAYGAADIGVAAVFVGVALLVTLVRSFARQKPSVAARAADALDRVVWLVAAAAIAAYVVFGASLIAQTRYHSDAVVAIHAGTERVLRGQNPYDGFDLVAELDRFGLPATFATPLEDGTRLRSLQYPALAILAPAPLVALGLKDIRVLFLAEVLAIFTLVMVTGRRGPWTALACCVLNFAVLDQFVVAGVDPLWVLLVLVSWVLRDGRWSAVALGLALAARQPAWLILPFVVAWAWRRYGAREALTRSGIAAGVAVLIHLPFLVTAPLAVIRGVTDPALLPLEPWGVGPARLAASGIGPLLPRGVYLGAAILAYVALLGAFATRRLRGALSLPLLPLWLSWRALLSYFAFLPIFLLMDDEDR